MTVTEEAGCMMLTFVSPDETVKGLKDVLSGEELLSIRAKDSDDMFRIRTMQRFVFSALKQQKQWLLMLALWVSLLVAPEMVSRWPRTV